MRKILAITTIRSDYDLLYPLYKLINSDGELELKLLVSGAHLSHTYGRSVDLIERDGFDILLKIESLIDSNTKQSRLKSASILLQNSIDIVSNYNPDLIMYSGDREDVIIGALLGGYLQIPTIHFWGGDHTLDGHIDNPIRHATSKLSTIHFVSIEDHKIRLLKIGESENRIFIIGNISLDRFYQYKPLTKDKIFDHFKIKKGFDKFVLVIFHPLDKEQQISFKIFENILKALIELNIYAFIGYPNSDPGNKKIIEIIQNYSYNEQFIFYKNIERELYLSIYKNCMLQIGNSSAGIIESASIPIPVVNVGERQKGRKTNGNVIFSDIDQCSIAEAIKHALSNKFLDKVKLIHHNIYGDGNSAMKAMKLIKEISFNKLLYKTEDPIN